MASQLAIGLYGPEDPAERVPLAEGAVLLRRFALAHASALLEQVHGITAVAPFRHMRTPGGRSMSAGLTSAGALGWVSDERGYRYAPADPLTGAPWPEIPAIFRALAVRAASEAGFAHFTPDSCLVNRYAPGARLALHRDENEKDFASPIVSFSLGLPATFLFGGHARHDPAERVPLEHGDVVVWGGPARLRYHGVLPVEDGFHPAVGAVRVNLTFRRAGL
jgi:alkylated DNA repair protein (DNA oxidative demethylase)